MTVPRIVFSKLITLVAQAWRSSDRTSAFPHVLQSDRFLVQSTTPIDHGTCQHRNQTQNSNTALPGVNYASITIPLVFKWDPTCGTNETLNWAHSEDFWVLPQDSEGVSWGLLLKFWRGTSDIGGCNQVLSEPLFNTTWSTYELWERHYPVGFSSLRSSIITNIFLTRYCLKA
jgi:hypothetical protein